MPVILNTLILKICKDRLAKLVNARDLKSLYLQVRFLRLSPLLRK